MVKRVRRLAAGGTSQVERICASEHDAAMTARFWAEWSTSKRLQALYEAHASSAELDATAVAKQICALKRVHAERACRNVALCLEDVARVNKTRVALRTLADTPFSREDEQHERMLDALWSALLPGVQREGGRVTREWGKLGFQQADPATDFRGGGVLALQQLLHFARTRPTVARRMIVEPAAEAARYPWACVGINITSETLKLLDARLLDRALYGLPVPRAVDTVHSIYADMFEVLHAMWLEAEPDNILAFPPVMKAAMERVREEITRTGTLVPPPADGAELQ